MHASAVAVRPAPRDPNDLYLRGLGCALVGYAVFGTGFAVLGVAPLYVGEVALGLGLLALMRTRCETAGHDAAAPRYRLSVSARSRGKRAGVRPSGHGSDPGG